MSKFPAGSKWLLVACTIVQGVVACATNDGRPKITGDAVGDVVVGRGLPPIDDGRILNRQWLHDESGEPYELVRLTVGGLPTSVELYQNVVWRIAVRSPGLKTANGIEVGASALPLLEGDAAVEPLIAPGPTIALVPEEPCGVSYLTDAKLPEILPSEGLSRKDFGKILGGARVATILVVGCGT